MASSVSFHFQNGCAIAAHEHKLTEIILAVVTEVVMEDTGNASGVYILCFSFLLPTLSWTHSIKLFTSLTENTIESIGQTLTLLKQTSAFGMGNHSP